MSEAHAISRRARAREDKLRRITQATRELFRTQGFDATTTAQIAERADVAKGTIFRYAPTKERLLVLMFEDDIRQIIDKTLQPISADMPVVDTLVTFFMRFFRLYEDNLELARRFVREEMFLASDDNPLSTLMQDFTHQLADIIRMWQKAGRIVEDVDALLAAQTTFGLYFVVLISWFSGRVPDSQTRDAFLVNGLTLHWRGLIVE
ncbi:MAG: TetR/AcrR family transcriptional regulator [Chloroflexota bacterium]